MARMRRRAASRTRSPSPRAAKRRDWVYTFESYDDNATPVQIVPDGEVWFPLANNWAYYLYTEGEEDLGRAGFGMPWPKRTAVRTVGTIHCFARTPLENENWKIQMQIERSRSEDTTGFPVTPINDIWDPVSYDRRVYWRRQYFPTSFSSWWNADWPPKPLNLVIPVDVRYRMPLDEQEIPVLVVGVRQYAEGQPLMDCRVQLRTQIEF